MSICLGNYIQMIKTLKIREDTHARLANHRKLGEIFEDVIIKLRLL